MKKQRKKLSKRKKKFFIWASCYIAVFLITSLLTMSTLSWFGGSTWQDGEMYMGGPVYIDFTDAEEIKTSGEGELTTETPPGWEKLYPGMNIHFEARAVLNNEFRPNREPIMAVSTAVMRAKVMLEIIDKDGHSTNDIDQTSDPEAYARIIMIYDSLWSQLRAKATIKEAGNNDPGYWVFLDKTTEQTLQTSETDKIEVANKKEEECYFYYVTADSYNRYTAGTIEKTDCIMEEIGITLEDDTSVGFLNDAVITVPGIPITNEHAECKIKFTIVFQALQAFFGHNPDQTEVPLTIANGYPIYFEAMNEQLVVGN